MPKIIKMCAVNRGLPCDCLRSKGINSITEWRRVLSDYLWRKYLVTVDDCTDIDEMKISFEECESPQEFADFKMDKYNVSPVI